MKITVRTPMKAEQIRELLENYQSDDVSFRFLGKAGINVDFEAKGPDADTVIASAKALIKGTSFGKVLNFSVVASE